MGLRNKKSVRYSCGHAWKTWMHEVHYKYVEMYAFGIAFSDSESDITYMNEVYLKMCVC